MALIPSARMQVRILTLLSTARGRNAETPEVQRAILYAVYGTDLQVRLPAIHRHRRRDGPEGILTVTVHTRTPRPCTV